MNLGYHLARLRGHTRRRIYLAMLPQIIRHPIRTDHLFPFDVVSYSSETDLPEQVASLRSFLKFAGRPRSFEVVSDGTHSVRSVRLLEAIDRCVRVRRVDDYELGEFPPAALGYLREHPTGKQLSVIMSLPVERPILYVDSDVRFFGGANHLAELLSALPGPANYLLDCRLSADERLLRDESEKALPVNTGVLWLREKLDWSLSWQRFAELDGPPNFFTNQTMTHLTMHAAGALPFDPEKFVLQLDDQFVFRDRWSKPDRILRHYVRPVRHKFWTA